MSWLLTIGLTNALVATLLAVVAYAVSRWLRRPALAHLLWILVLVKLLTPPLVEIPIGWSVDPAWLDTAEPPSRPAVVAAEPVPRQGPVAPTAPHVEVAAVTSVPIDVARPSSPPPTKSFTPPTFLIDPRFWLSLVAAVWVVGACLWLACFLRRAWQFQQYLSRAGKHDELLNAAAQRLAKSAGLRRAPRVVVVEQIVSPLLWGIGRGATVVFPRALVTRLETSARDSLLLHEIGHFARGDHYVRWLELAARIVFWWHPLVWLAVRQIEIAEEQCCDAWVVERAAGRRLYAEALLATVDFLASGPGKLPPVACGLGELPLLRERLTRIMHGDGVAHMPASARWGLLLAALTILPLGPSLFASSRPEVKALPSRNDIAEPIAKPAYIENTTPPAVAPDIQPSENDSASAELPPPAPRGTLWATASASNALFKLEARTGRQTTLIGLANNFRLDMSAHAIACAHFAPDSQTFSTGHADAAVRIWDTATGGLLVTLRGGEAAITSVHFSPDGRRIAAGTADGKALVWNLKGGVDPLYEQSLGAHVGCVRWSRGGDRLAVALGEWNASQASLVVWNPVADAITLEEPLPQVAGALAWLDGDRAIAAAGWNGEASVWNVGTATIDAQFAVAKDAVSASAWSADCVLVP